MILARWVLSSLFMLAIMLERLWKVNMLAPKLVLALGIFFAIMQASKMRGCVHGYR